MSASLTPPLPSDRKFGLFFSGLLALIAAILATRGRWGLALSPTVLSLAFLVLAVWAPSRLALLNLLWFRFGLLLARVVSPIVLGVMFFGLLTPVALVTRLFGRDVLRLKKRSQPTHWIERSPAGPARGSFGNQF